MAGSAQPLRSAGFEPESLEVGPGNAIAERAGSQDEIEDGRVPLRDSRRNTPVSWQGSGAGGLVPGFGIPTEIRDGTGRLVNNDRIYMSDNPAASPHWSCPS